MKNNKKNYNNQAIVEGEIVSDFEYSHSVFGEAFYFVKLKVSRFSELNDTVPMLISERLIDVCHSYIGRYAQVHGQFRSYNYKDADGRHLMLSLFVKGICLLDDQKDYEKNLIFLDGYICRKPVYRVTPMGKEIADVLLAVNRAYSKTDYIPCILWGRNARYADRLKVGRRIQLWGRIQSRDYQKKLTEENVIEKVAYEISVNKLEFRQDHIEAYDMVAEVGNSYMYC